MFKVARWRSHKKRIKAVFKLQFHATQVPKVKGNSLMISLVPEDVGKPTVRLEKAAVLDGTCSWDNPIYETVKLAKDPKTGMLNEKVFFFVVSAGSSKKGYLGEVYLNFADYVEATKPSTVSMLLTNSNSGPILHVTIQNMEGTVDQREFEDTGSPISESQDGSFKNQTRNSDRDGDGIHYFAEDERFNDIMPQNEEENGSSRDSQLQGSIIRQDLTTLRLNSLPQKRTTVNANLTEIPHEHRRSNTDWSISSMSEGSIAESPNSPEENFPINRFQEGSDKLIEKLKSEISMLERQAEVSELELQTLRKQVVKDNRRGQDLSRQILSLNEENDTLKTQCEELKSSQKYVEEQMESKNSRVLEEIKQELYHEKDLNTTLRLQLQKTEDTNSELILAVRDLDEMLEQKNRQISDLSDLIKDSQTVEEAAETHSRELDLLKQKIAGLYGEIEVYKKDREELNTNMEQLIAEYDILKQENHDISSTLKQNQIQQMKMQNESSESSATIKAFKIQVERLEKEINKQALELSEASATISDLETQVKILEKELEKQAQSFEDDLEAMTRDKIEQEQRVIRAEEALRKTRLNNANAAERLQEDFRRISAEMEAKFDENEKLTMKAVTEANDLRLQKGVLEERLRKANDELGLIKDQFEIKMQELSNQSCLREKQTEQMSLELDEKCKQVKKHEKYEEEMHETFAIETQKLKEEIERLKVEKNGFSEKAGQKRNLRDEKEQLKTVKREQEMLERWGKEREELEREFASLRREAEELNTLRSLKEEKDAMVGVLQSEVEKLKAHYNELKQRLLEEESEKEKLKKEVFELEFNLRKKEEEQKEQKEAAPGKSANYLVTEKAHRKKTGEIESNMKYFDHNRSAYADQYQQETELAADVNSNTRELVGRRNRGENVQLSAKSSTEGTSKLYVGGTAPVTSKLQTHSEKELEVSTLQISDGGNHTKLLSEVALLKERNDHKERELKEMEDRYSAISLKFAEVEGERQQLVMTVRNLKNGKKN